MSVFLQTLFQHFIFKNAHVLPWACKMCQDGASRSGTKGFFGPNRCAMMEEAQESDLTPQSASWKGEKGAAANNLHHPLMQIANLLHTWGVLSAGAQRCLGAHAQGEETPAPAAAILRVETVFFSSAFSDHMLLFGSTHGS